MTRRPRIVIGVPLYNGSEHLAEAVESLLAQTYSDFELVMVDDCSTDRTAEIVSAHAANDKRIHFSRNETRLGLVGNWRRAFEIAQELQPELDYFAWGSDHDIWAPRWLESLLGELEAHPEAVLAYPRMATIDEGGEPLRKQPRPLDTTGVDDPWARAELTWKQGGFGYRVYGLHRAETLSRCGVFRAVYMPDRLQLMELVLHGHYREVPEVLWFRRRRGNGSVARQRAAFFPNGRVPWKFRVRWCYSHSGILLWSLTVRGRARPGVTRREGAAIATRYLKLGREHWRTRRRRGERAARP